MLLLILLWQAHRRALRVAADSGSRYGSCLKIRLDALFGLGVDVPTLEHAFAQDRIGAGFDEGTGLVGELDERPRFLKISTRVMERRAVGRRAERALNVPADQRAVWVDADLEPKPAAVGAQIVRKRSIDRAIAPSASC
jgi:hypothetical protein